MIYILKMRCMLWVFLVLATVSCILAQSGNGTIDNGLAAGTELAQAIGDKNFKSTIGKLLTKIGPYLGMIGPAIGMILSIFGGSQDSAEVTFMKSMLSKIENRFDQVDSKLEAISRKIDWNTARINFFPYEKNILIMKTELDRLYNAASKEEFISLQSAFTQMYECVYQKSGLMLYNHVVSKDFTFSKNLLDEAMKALQYDRNELQIFMVGIAKLVLIGSEIDMAYYKFKLPNSQIKLKNTWADRMKRLSQAMDAADRVVEGMYLEAAMKDAKTIATFNKGASTKDLATMIYDKLKNKYYWRNWMVGISTAISGSYNYQAMLCNGADALWHSGYNLLLASNRPYSEKLHYRRASADVILNMISIRARGWWMSEYEMNAQEIFDKASYLRDCNKWTGFGLIRSGDLYCAAERTRIASTIRGSYSIFLFQ